MGKLNLTNILCIVVVLSMIGCRSGSGGSFLPKGSLAWHAFASPVEKQAAFDNMSTAQLCVKWSAAYPGGHPAWEKNRLGISEALQRRGLSPMYCANPSADEASVLRDQVNAAKAEAERARLDAERAKRAACQERMDAYRQCTSGQSSYNGYQKCGYTPIC